MQTTDLQRAASANVLPSRTNSKGFILNVFVN